VDANDNELAYLEAIHFFVEVLDQFFGNVCELDLVFNFYKVRSSGSGRRRKVLAAMRLLMMVF
jgi:AP-2 complex subunit sigma-1